MPMQCLGYLPSCPWQSWLHCPGTLSDATTVFRLEQRRIVTTEWASVWLGFSKTASFPKWGSVELERSYGKVAEKMKTEKWFGATVPLTGVYCVLIISYKLIHPSFYRCNKSKEMAEISATAANLDSGTTKLDRSFLLLLVELYVLRMSLDVLWSKFGFQSFQWL